MNRPVVGSLAAFVLLSAGALGAADSRQIDAIRAQRELLEANTGSAALWNDLGNLLVEVGDLGEAERSYRNALAIDARHEGARFNLAMLLHESGRLDEASVEYEALLVEHPQNAWGHYLLGSIFEARKRRRQAVAAYAEAFSLDRQLLYPDVNPHIISSRYVAEALLRSRDVKVALAPRSYDDADRIRGLLTREPEEPAAEPRTKKAKGRDDSEERVLDEESLDDVPNTNQLESAPTAPRRKGKRRNN